MHFTADWPLGAIHILALARPAEKDKEALSCDSNPEPAFGVLFFCVAGLVELAGFLLGGGERSLGHVCRFRVRR